jgi:hypothetical protein
MDVKARKIQLFHKRVIEKKPMGQCAAELGISRRQASTYQNTEDYRTMALKHLDEGIGIEGTVNRLVAALDSTRAVVIQDKEGTQEIKNVPDERTRTTALQELIKIYGLHAPERKDTSFTLSVATNDELYSEIDKAQRICGFEAESQTGQRRTKVVNSKSIPDTRSFASRKRTLLSDDALQESV